METATEDNPKYHDLVNTLNGDVQNLRTINRDVILQLIALDQKEKLQSPAVPPLVPSANRLELDKLREDGQKLEEELTTQQSIISDLLSHISKIQTDENSIRDQLATEKLLIEQLTKQRDELRSVLEEKGLIVPGENAALTISKSASSKGSISKPKHPKPKSFFKFLSNSEKSKKSNASAQNSDYSFGSRTERFS
ncbi:uncharacterized protein LOC129585943 [Paramacrobiotus metropolitanus]|uniref:uncharacterized protein LOC129585943 n=1 Tax=Paramacrobiotus metropolitanus TaxID=2943436 RepID=UPI00244639E6|nr:uncharacterized protein LOC129585943 [Paramacrobiotus metropolitanus]